METSRPEEPSKKVEAPETAPLQYKSIIKTDASDRVFKRVLL